MADRPNSFDITVPTGSDSPRNGDNEIRDIKRYTQNAYNDLTQPSGVGIQRSSIYTGTGGLYINEEQVTATATELNYTDGVTSNIQTQLNGLIGNSFNFENEMAWTTSGSQPWMKPAGVTKALVTLIGGGASAFNATASTDYTFVGGTRAVILFTNLPSAATSYTFNVGASVSGNISTSPAISGNITTFNDGTYTYRVGEGFAARGNGGNAISNVDSTSQSTPTIGSAVTLPIATAPILLEGILNSRVLTLGSGATTAAGVTLGFSNFSSTTSTNSSLADYGQVVITTSSTAASGRTGGAASVQW